MTKAVIFPGSNEKVEFESRQNHDSRYVLGSVVLLSEMSLFSWGRVIKNDQKHRKK